MRQLRVKAPALVLAAFAMACSDPAVGPSRALLPDAPSFAVSNAFYNGPTGPGGGLLEGDVRLCKTANAAGTFGFSVTVDGQETAANESITLLAAGTQCITVHHSVIGGNGTPSAVVITENADQANWALTSINTVRHLATGLYNAGGYTPPRQDDVESLANRRATVYINNDMARTVTFTNTYTPPPPPGGGEGCTPGYWKQEHHFDSWPAPYTPNTLMNVALNLPGTLLWPANFTMLQALGANGGGKNALARHAAAALLNAASNGVDFDLTVAQVQAAVLAAYNNGSLIEAKKNLLGQLNEQGCPLN